MTEGGSRSDFGRQAIALLAFGVSLGATTIIYPLLALESGYGIAVVGVFTAVSAAAQFIARLLLPSFLARFPDRTLMVSAAGLLALSICILFGTTALIGFIAGQMFQGIARALFWTASQTHAVRTPGRTTRRLALVQTLGTAGGLGGPIFAGAAAETSYAVALLLGLGSACIAIIVCLSLQRHPSYTREPDRVPIWRLSGIGNSAWAGSVGGIWRGVLDSFVPAIFSSVGMAPSLIGTLLSLSDGASFATTAIMSQLELDRFVLRLVPISAVAVGLAVAGVPFARGPMAAAVVIVGGIGGGLGLVLGPAAASLIAVGGEQGAGIALAGTYRAGARFVAPTAISAISTVAPIGVALAAVAIGVMSPIATRLGGWLRP